MYILFILLFNISEAEYTPKSSEVNTPSHVVHSGLIGKGTIYETQWVEMIGHKDGKSIIIEAGIHGDEIAGTLAVESLIPEIIITKGRVIWLPQMNKPAYQDTKRFINVDLNKVFPGDKTKKDYEYSLAAELFEWVGNQNADVVVTLHESRYLHDGSNPKTFGQTIVYGVKPQPQLLSLVLDDLNTELKESRHRFYSNYFPIATSSTEQFVSNFNLEGYCAETWRGFEISTRVQLQKELVLSFFDQLGIEYILPPVSIDSTTPN